MTCELIDLVRALNGLTWPGAFALVALVIAGVVLAVAVLLSIS